MMRKLYNECPSENKLILLHLEGTHNDTWLLDGYKYIQSYCTLHDLLPLFIITLLINKFFPIYLIRYYDGIRDFLDKCQSCVNVVVTHEQPSVKTNNWQQIQTV